MTINRPEYEARIATLRGSMAARDIDLILFFGQEPANYLSGFYSHGHFAFTVLGIPASGEPFLVLRQMEVEAARATSWVGTHYVFNDGEDPVECAAAAVRAIGLAARRIACDVQSWYLTVERFDALRAHLPEASFVAEGRLVDEMRLIKSEAELALLGRAAQAVDAAMQAALTATAPGVSERKVAAAMAAARIEAGSDLPIDGVLTTGERTLQGHGGWTDRCLQAGDPFLYEFHGIVGHYWARNLRSGVLGKASARQRGVASTLIDAQDALIRRLVPGGSSRDADAACRTPLFRAGLKQPDTFTRRIGYSLGLNFRPSPGEMIREISPAMDFEIRPGMVFMLLLSHEGIGIGDTVAVTDAGPRLLTRLPRIFHEIEA